MKSTNRAALVLAALAGVVAAALVGWIAVLTVNLEITKREPLALQKRLDHLSTAEKKDAALMRELEQALQAESNRTAAAEAKYQEEKSTHDPLRAQIERMMAAAIRRNADTTNDQRRIADFSRSLRESQDAVQSLTTSKKNLTRRVEILEDERQEAALTLSGLRVQLATAESCAASLSNAFLAAQADMAKMEQTLAASEQRFTGLTNEIAVRQLPLK